MVDDLAKKGKHTPLATLEEEPDNRVPIVAHALVFLEQQLLERSESSEALKEVFPHHDLNMCTYCGTGDDNLKVCTRCKFAKYCNANCQKKHWKMKASLGLKTLCHQVANAKGH